MDILSTLAERFYFIRSYYRPIFLKNEINSSPWWWHAWLAWCTHQHLVDSCEHLLWCQLIYYSINSERETKKPTQKALLNNIMSDAGVLWLGLIFSTLLKGNTWVNSGQGVSQSPLPLKWQCTACGFYTQVQSLCIQTLLYSWYDWMDIGF